MTNYDFQTLNDREFEKLTRDLLQKKLRFDLESFKPGKDGGIDLRYATPKKDSKIIIQAKHRIRSSFNDLFSHLKKEELPKVKKLKPSRYILSTSTEFNPEQKNKIKDLFKPFIKTSGDILGRDELNGLLLQYPEIEEGHPKLWLSSTQVLRRILHNGIKGRSDFTESSIRKNISLYVANQKYSEALNILNRERFLVVIGEPGIGKTVLARMLIYHLLGDNYKVITVNEKISEAEDLWDPNTKQVFYFDDFMGANYLEVASNNNSDSALVSFIKRIKTDPKKRLILTSRTAVLNNATQVYTKLKDPVINLAKHEVKVENYTKLDKAQILYNHLYFMGLGEDYKEKIRENKNYWKIINHTNYNPRLVEFISDPLRTSSTKPSNYLDFILKNLDNPVEIWRDAYQVQLDDYGKFLLQTLFSFGSDIEERYLKIGFNERLDYEIKHNGFKRKADLFNITLKHLMGGFIKGTRRPEYLFLDFFNPSLVDFLINLLEESPEEKWRIIDSAKFTCQLTLRFAYQNKNYFSPEELTRLEKLIKEKESVIENLYGGSCHVDLIQFCYFAFSEDVADPIITNFLLKTNLDQALPEQSEIFRSSLEYIQSYSKSREVVIKRWREIIDYLFNSCSAKEELESVYNIFSDYRQSYEEYIENMNSAAIVENGLTTHWNQTLFEIESGIVNANAVFKNPEDADNFLEETYSDAISLNEKFKIKPSKEIEQIRDISGEDLYETVAQLHTEEDFAFDYHKEDYYASRAIERNMERDIDSLFEK